jgi:putative ABC transport system permease protein
MQVIAGRNFQADSKVDSASSMLINQELANMLGWEKPVGRTIGLSIGQNEDATPFTVIGVVRNFNFATVQHPIEPLYMRYGNTNSVLSIRISGSNISEAIKNIGGIWGEVYPDNLFEYSFMEDDFDILYENESAFASMFNHLTFLAIFIAIMGLFGLSAFAAEQRTKEIGIRKVLGAKVGQIVFMLSKEFIILVIIAFVLAIPVAWFGAGIWLETFVYHIDFGWGIFILAAFIAVLVALLTVSWQSLKVAISNPSESLRDE